MAIKEKRRQTAENVAQDIQDIRYLYACLENRGHDSFFNKNARYSHLKNYFEQKLKNVLQSEFRWFMLNPVERSEYALELAVELCRFNFEFAIDYFTGETLVDIARNHNRRQGIALEKLPDGNE